MAQQQQQSQGESLFVVLHFVTGINGEKKHVSVPELMTKRKSKRRIVVEGAYTTQKNSQHENIIRLEMYI